MFTLVRRSIRLFFTDKVAMVLSLFGALIAIFLILIFLKSTIVDSMAADLAGIVTRDHIENLLDSWLIASACVIASATTGLGALGYYVEDRETARWRDFLVTPLPRWSITGGYLLGAAVISIIMTTVMFVLGTVFCLVSGVPLSVLGVLESWGWLMVCSLGFTSLMGFLVSLIKTNGAFTGLSIIIGVLFGFLAMTYVTASALPEGARSFFSSLPFAQASALVRKPYTAETLATFPNQVHQSIMESMGITLKVGTTEITSVIIVAVLVAMVAIFAILSWQTMTRAVRR